MIIDCKEAIEFLKKAWAATDRLRGIVYTVRRTGIVDDEDLVEVGKLAKQADLMFTQAYTIQSIMNEGRKR